MRWTVALSAIALSVSTASAQTGVPKKLLPGFQPPVKGEDGKPGYLQPITLVEYQPDREASSMTLTHASKLTIWHDPDVVGSYKHAVDLTAGVIFAGFGITAPE